MCDIVLDWPGDVFYFFAHKVVMCLVVTHKVVKYSQTQNGPGPAYIRKRVGVCVLITNTAWSCCDYASARNCINDSCRFDAVSQTDDSALNPFLNPACHTKASCKLLCQRKHINATLYTVITSQVKEGLICFESALMSSVTNTHYSLAY